MAIRRSRCCGTLTEFTPQEELGTSICLAWAALIVPLLAVRVPITSCSASPVNACVRLFSSPPAPSHLLHVKLASGVATQVPSAPVPLSSTLRAPSAYGAPVANFEVQCRPGSQVISSTILWCFTVMRLACAGLAPNSARAV